MLDIDISQ